MLDLKYHIEDNLAEQDVYVERIPGSGEVYRVTKYDRDMKAPLYATAQPQPHNPFDPGTEGPYRKGAPLGLTLGRWFAADGTARFQRVFQPCLQLSGEHLAAGIAVTWQSDGETWGVEPGPFGSATHVQLYAFLPPRPGL